MGVPSSQGRAAPRAAGRSVSFYLAAGLLVPVTVLLALWGLLTGLVLAGYLDKLRWLSTQTPSHRALIGAALITGAGLVVVIVAVIRLGWLARRISAELSGLSATAGVLAGEQLPRIVAALRNGEQVPDDFPDTAWPDTAIAEIGGAAAAITGLERAAVTAAAAEAALRHGFRQILVSLGRRNQSLLHRQLRIIDNLEQQASDPAALADLFTLDHLTTRMRRHAESLTILSGAASGRSWSGPVPVIDVMRAAAAEVEDYTRVTVITDSDEAIAATAVTDMIHLLAELIENATLFSPSSTRVEVRAERVANGFAVEVEDRGLGIPPEQLAQINAQLDSPPDFHQADADRLGLFVAARLAERHGVHVALSPSAYRGTKAVVVMPDSIVVAQAGQDADLPGDDIGLGRAARLNLRSPEVLSLAGVALSGSLSAPGEPTGEQAFALAADAQAGQPASTTIHGLPRRIRPAGTSTDTSADGAADSAAAEDIPAAEALAAAPAGGLDGMLEAWDDEPSGAGSRAAAHRHVPPDSPAPEHARTLAASLQHSWRLSRLADTEPGLGPDASTDAGTGDSAPDSEEA